MNKKGVEMTLQTIIVAILVLLVLGLLVYFLLNAGNDFTDNTNCIKRGGTCKTICEQGKEDPIGSDLCSEGLMCCKLKSSVLQ